MKRTALTSLSGASIVAAILLIATPARIFSDRLSGDDASYVAHALTIALDADLDYSNEALDWTVAGPSGPRPAHPIGPGLAAAPVVAAFALLDRLESHPIIEDRSEYSDSRAILGFFVASAAALGGGLLALISAIRLSVGRATALRTVVVSVLGSGVPFYALNRFTMSHSFEFLFLSLIILAAVRLARSRRGRTTAWLLLSLASAMTVLIRPGNLPFLLLPLWVVLAVRISSGAPIIRNPRRDIVSGASAFAIFWLPAFWLQQHLYGSAITLSYRLIAGSYWSGPDGLSETLRSALTRLDIGRLLLLLFGAEFGVAWSSFVIIGGIVAAGAVVWRSSDADPRLRFAFGVLGGLLLIAPIVSVFGAGQMGIDYGNRFLYPLVPPAAFALGLALSSTPGRRQSRIGAFVVCMACVGIISTSFYQSAGTADRLLTHAPQTNIFGEEASSARFYGRELVEEVRDPRAWARVLAVRAPGFFVVRIADEDQVLQFGGQLGVPEARLADGLRWAQHFDLLDVIVVAATLIGLIVVLLQMSDPQRDRGQERAARRSR